MNRLADYRYDLPEKLIAQTPVPERDTSALMAVDIGRREIRHLTFGDFRQYLQRGDCLVLNDTRVMPARLAGCREGSGGRVELILLRQVDPAEQVWETLAGPARKAKPGDRLVFGDGLHHAEVLSVMELGQRLVRFDETGAFPEILRRIGQMPLPPYIHQVLEDPERYQTVYATQEGSAAAPTAGLHFTRDLLDDLTEKGVEVCYLTLHVGIGTFRPVRCEDIRLHVMHEEYYHLPEETAEAVNHCRDRGNRVIAVGTTSLRVLETQAESDGSGKVRPGSGWTSLFIYPGFRFRVVDSLLTNFHLPESTLLMLVSAFAGRELIMEAYREAISREYRFFSFGDAMFLYNRSREEER